MGKIDGECERRRRMKLTPTYTHNRAGRQVLRGLMIDGMTPEEIKLLDECIANPGDVGEILGGWIAGMNAELRRHDGTEEVYIYLPAHGRCRICGCTDDCACDGGCFWANEERTLCSRCVQEGASS